MGMGTGRSAASLASLSGATIALLVAVAACGSPNSLAGIPNASVTPVVLASHGPTPLAVEPVATLAARSTKAPTTAPTAAPTAKPTAKPTPRPTPKPTAAPSFYKPPGWDGYSDVDCPDFDTHAHAQSFFIGTGGSKTNDPYRLDNDHDGIACESLP
jgi:hypothetical protein